MDMALIVPGDVVRDTITGFKGTVVAVTRWLNGCDRITIQGKGTDKNGNPAEPYTVDSVQIEVLETREAQQRKKALENRIGHRKTGGPRPRAHARARPEVNA